MRRVEVAGVDLGELPDGGKEHEPSIQKSANHGDHGMSLWRTFHAHNRVMVTQAVGNGSLLALPYDYCGKDKPRIPRLLVEEYAAVSGSRGKRRPLPLIELRESLWQRCRELNRIGTGEHPIYMRTGCFTPA